ncbi:MAG: 30S ribosomal protein S20 [Puniceicoccales bacterium]|jgi:small subunit ribosomal protein S20|nr:30S ribosomal protein S20 [Puniceicoccales bacterium]
MANLKSSLKDVRRAEKRTIRNRNAKSELRTLARRVSEAAPGEAARAAAISYVSAVDKAVKRGIIHRNRASSTKSAVAPLIFSSAE